MRAWIRPSRWLPPLVFLISIYALLLTFSTIHNGNSALQRLPLRTRLKSDYDYPNDVEPVAAKKFTLILNSSRYETLEVENVLTSDKATPFQERFFANVDYKALPKIILSWDAGHGPENLGGCPDWNCIFTYDRSKAAEAAVVLTVSADYTRKSADQIIAYYSQESPKNMPMNVPKDGYFNVSLGYRHDTTGASPYGYTVKLAKKRKLETVVNSSRLEGKTKSVAWFVSHCTTNSKREDFVLRMQKYIKVDIYGHCLNGLSCPRGDSCEDMLDDDYHFYLAFENSICTDYITEKVWNQGYGRDIAPLVLKRSIAENRLPPNSFIAVDDFATVQELTEHLEYLIANKTAYREMFSWRRDYAVIFLNGEQHDILERPWGFCQLCRIAWENPKQSRVINDFKQWWDQSCEKDGETVDKILGQSAARESAKDQMLRGNRITIK